MRVLEARSAQTSEGTVGSVLGSSPTVVVWDAEGHPLANVTVRFTLSDADGGASLATPLSTTNSDGVASAGNWAIGSRAGTHAVYVSTDGAAGIAFTVKAVADVAAQIHWQDNGTPGYAGMTLRPAAIVSDRFGNEVASAAVSFAIVEGTGSLQSGSAASADDGVATPQWTLGSGANAISASLAGASAPSVLHVEAFNATSVYVLESVNNDIPLRIGIANAVLALGDGQFVTVISYRSGSSAFDARYGGHYTADDSGLRLMSSGWSAEVVGTIRADRLLLSAPSAWDYWGHACCQLWLYRKAP